MRCRYSALTRRLDLFENREQLEELRADLIIRNKAAEKLSEMIRDHTQKQPAAASNAEQEAIRAKDAHERLESAWLEWQSDHPEALAAASRHLELEDEIRIATTPARPASTACELLASRRETLVKEVQGNLRTDRLKLKQDARFTDYRDIDENDFDDNTYAPSLLVTASDSSLI
jgi:hypothetical protein